MKPGALRGADAVRPGVRALAAYALVPPPAASVVAKLDFNEAPFDVPDDVKEEVLSRLRALRWSRYPELGAPRLVDAVARQSGRRPEEVVVGNGSGEILLSAVGVLAGGGGTLVIPSPSFSLYGQLAALADARVVSVPRSAPRFDVDLPALLAALEGAERPVGLVCSPNNPTGGTVPLEALAEVASRASALLVDQAYVDFAEAEDDARSLLDRFENVVVFRTLSKAFAAAGFRIGYALASPALAAEVRKGVLPFSVDLAAEELALSLLSRPGLSDRAVSAVKAERDRVASALAGLGADVAPSRANFLWTSLPGIPGSALRQGLLDRGVLVRQPGSAEAGYVRVTIGTRAENDLFLTAMKEIR